MPSKAVRARNTKKAARLGASAVPVLQTRNSAAVTRVTYFGIGRCHCQLAARVKVR